MARDIAGKIATLAKEEVLPERQAERLYRVLEGETKLLIDATESRVGRSVDKKTPREYFSGKQKPHH